MKTLPKPKPRPVTSPSSTTSRKPFSHAEFATRFWRALAPLEHAGVSRSTAFAKFCRISFLGLQQALRARGSPEWEVAEAEFMRELTADTRLPAPTVQQALGAALGETIVALEQSEGDDVLGPLYMEAGANAAAGQFFTPSAIADAMAEMTLHDAPEAKTILEPACGAGVTVLALARALRKKGRSPTELRVEAWDIAAICVHMAFVQFTFCGIPAVVVHGNTLTQEVWGRYPNLLMSQPFRVALLARAVA